MKLCKLIGHKWNECGMQHGVKHCDRCDYSDCDWLGVKSGEEWTLPDEISYRSWRVKTWLRFRWLRLKWMFTKDDGTPF